MADVSRYPKVADLMAEKEDLLQKLSSVKSRIATVQLTCPHENNEYVKDSPDPHSGKRDTYATCLDCGYGRWL